jgi:uncharacterized protein (TIGR03067 family)
MRFIISAMALACAITALAEDKKPEPTVKDEMQKLQGEWLALEVGASGMVFDIKGDKQILAIKDSNFTFTGDEKAELSKLDPKADPKRFDLKNVGKLRMGQMDGAIYKIEGDKLTICLRQGKTEGRPEKFATAAGQTDVVMIVLERVKKK